MGNRDYTDYYWRLHNDSSIPIQHIEYLKSIDYYPKVIYDIGSAVLHWTKEAKKIWSNSIYYNFEAVLQVEEFYLEYGSTFSLNVFSDMDDKELIFYNHPLYLGGNSYYKENEIFSPAAKNIYDEKSYEIRLTKKIDTIVFNQKFRLPDFVKIDVECAEIDILKGMKETLKNVKHMIVELQHVEYNLGAKKIDESIPFIESLGFELVSNKSNNKYFCGNGPDADYHFIRK
jgi:FkbM family methyltransferase